MRRDRRPSGIVASCDAVVVLLLGSCCGGGSGLLGVLVMRLLLLLCLLLLLVVHPSWLAVGLVLLLVREDVRPLEHLGGQMWPARRLEAEVE